jgi:hypothetical protein
MLFVWQRKDSVIDFLWNEYVLGIVLRKIRNKPMKLSSVERSLIADHVAAFAMKMILSVGQSEEQIHAELDDFYQFFCNALEAAKRDARKEALITTTN